MTSENDDLYRRETKGTSLASSPSSDSSSDDYVPEPYAPRYKYESSSTSNATTTTTTTTATTTTSTVVVVDAVEERRREDESDFANFERTCAFCLVATKRLYAMLESWKKLDVSTIVASSFYAVMEEYRNKMDADERVRFAIYAKMKKVSEEYDRYEAETDDYAVPSMRHLARKLAIYEAYVEAAKNSIEGTLVLEEERERRKSSGEPNLAPVGPFYKKALRNLSTSSIFSTCDLPPSPKLNPFYETDATGSNDETDSYDEKERLTDEEIDFANAFVFGSTFSSKISRTWTLPACTLDDAKRREMLSKAAKTPWINADDIATQEDLEAMGAGRPLYKYYWHLARGLHHDVELERDYEDVPGRRRGDVVTLNFRSMRFNEWKLDWSKGEETFESEAPYVTIAYAIEWDRPERVTATISYTLLEYVDLCVFEYAYGRARSDWIENGNEGRDFIYDEARDAPLPREYWKLLYLGISYQIKWRCDYVLLQDEIDGSSFSIGHVATLKTTAKWLVFRHYVLNGAERDFNHAMPKKPRGHRASGRLFGTSSLDKATLKASKREAANRELVYKLQALGDGLFEFCRTWYRDPYRAVLTNAKNPEDFDSEVLELEFSNVYPRT